MTTFSMERLWSYVDLFTTFQYPTNTPQHPDSFPSSKYYNAGRLDLFFLITCIAVMAVLRDALRLGVFEPFARWKLMRDLTRKHRTAAASKTNGVVKAQANGHATNGHAANGNGHTNGLGNYQRPTTKELKQVNRSVLRFAEQGWSVVYYTFIWSYGLYLHYNFPTKLLEPKDVWTGYPHIPLATSVKFYYLTQTAFYLHQILILNAEARRKDHIQMMVHHVITSLLLIISYMTNFTRVGCLILMLMDWCDIYLPLAKMIRYIAVSQFACDLTFGWFMVSWLVTRHIFFTFVILSTLRDCPRYIPFLLDPERGFYLTKIAFINFCAMLIILQILQCIWFWMICRVAWRVVRGSGASDDRSDEEFDDKKDS